MKEKSLENTTEINGMGFTGYDGNFMTSIAKQFIKSKSISAKQFRAVKKNMKKYSGQLLKITLNEIKDIDCNIDKLIPKDCPVIQWVRPG